jgi:subtilisin family serine protease
VEPSGAERFEGQILLTVDHTFDAQSLAPLLPGIALLHEGGPDARGVRSILAMLPEDKLASAIEQLRTKSGVIAADRHLVFRPAFAPNDPFWSAQQYSGTYLLNMENASNITRGRASVRVAVIDTGVNSVSDLAAQLDDGVNFLDFPPSNDTEDSVGHGTQVASIAAATGNNATGITGIAPRVRVVPLNVCYYNPVLSHYCPGLSVSEALAWAADNRIDVVNLSITPTDQVDGIKYRIDVLVLQTTIVVGAAGNGGSGSVKFPAAYEPVVAVGGVGPDGARHPMSDYGSALDFAAPFTAFALAGSGGVETFSGTSASAAFISGLAALYKSEYAIEQQVQFSFLGVAGFTNQPEWNSQTGRGVPDAWKMLWYGGCFRFDMNNDRAINLSDAQFLTGRFGMFYLNPAYRGYFDISPVFERDGAVGMADIQRVFERTGTTCKR